MKIRNPHRARPTETTGFVKGTIESVREEGVRIWQRDGDGIYVTCPQCSKIANIADHLISKDGSVTPCVNCAICSTHYFPQLLSWDGSYTLACMACRFVAFIKPGEKETGWKKRPISGCSCCSTLLCPKCDKAR